MLYAHDQPTEKQANSRKKMLGEGEIFVFSYVVDVDLLVVTAVVPVLVEFDVVFDALVTVPANHAKSVL